MFIELTKTQGPWLNEGDVVNLKLKELDLEEHDRREEQKETI
jgi:hypothetical protein